MNIIHSGLIRKLAQEYHVHLLSTMIRSAEIGQINGQFGLDLKLVNLNLPSEPAWLTCLRKVEKAFFAQHFDITTQKIKYQSQKEWFWMRKVLWLISQKNFNKWVLRLIRHSIIFLTSFSIKLKPLLSYHFHGLISSSPLDSRENRIVNFLRRRNIKTLAMVISWDNLTSKGVINADHDCTLVWNDFMKKEFLCFYSIFNITKPKVIATGIPRFDCYFQTRPENKHAEARARFNVPPENQVILVATSAFRHFPNQLDVITDLLRFAKREGNLHVIIRCHPADNVGAYNQLSDEKIVTIWHPKNLPTVDNERFYNWFPELDFLDSLSQMLRICDVCVHFASTMKLDAAACGKHLISIAYDGNAPLSDHQSVKRLYDYNHQIPLNALQVDEFVTSREQLYTALKVCLSKQKSENELAAIKSFTHFTEPKSVDFTFKTIVEWLN
ncbi:CDP-glycerol glycerophosphotransferase family protein [Dyadobacter psychrophilus]|uniref:CDP-Glycerol:Poly(Glycerophosphate) glycerophosphotransferase n=1 Tax=Dyadobacter psychrophilus TaxID=651661 RepID=A0A1T5HBL6_9BACT|nr:CDP-glycerol glycerophosphotransferase family protein [Dyadobacter psychrophilus]SKC18105.1 CDP-Glycerol:Poly(glycerophosphate) glycerophosphotransferase [Dyadobacter psychrophilus]